MDQFAYEYANLGTPLDVGINLEKAIKNRAKELQKEVKDAYDKIPTGYTVPGEVIKEIFAETIGDFRDNISAGVKKRIENFIVL